LEIDAHLIHEKKSIIFRYGTPISKNHFIKNNSAVLCLKGKGEQLTYWVLGQNLEYRKHRIKDESVKYPALIKNFED
jgi:hypothetical protein